MKPLHLSWSDAPQVTFVAADVTCEACRARMARRRLLVAEAGRLAVEREG